MDAEGMDSPLKGVAAGEEAATPERTDAPFFERPDWWSFAAATGVMLGVYFLSLAPNVTLGLPAQFATGAMYGGVAAPPGYPLWTLYAWLFTELLPCSNIAWRVSVSSAVAAALSCGCIALMISRGIAQALAELPAAGRWEQKEATQLRILCSTAASATFGATNSFWHTALVANPWPLSMLLLCLTLVKGMQWLWAPECKRPFYATCFLYGLTLTNSQALVVLAPGLVLMAWLGDRQLGRNIYLIGVGVLGFILFHGSEELLYRINHCLMNHVLLGGCVVTGAVLLCILTRELREGWRRTLLGASAFLSGLLPYGYLPLYSVTNPPVNHAHTRTVEGFLHCLSRGQYERTCLTSDWEMLAEQIGAYGAIALDDYGPVPLFLAFTGLALHFLAGGKLRTWTLSLLAAYVCLTVLMTAVVKPTLDRSNLELINVFFSGSNVIVAVGLGLGMFQLGIALGARYPKADQ